MKTSQFVHSLYLLIVAFFFFITEAETCILWGGNVLANGNQLSTSMGRTFLGEDFSKNFFSGSLTRQQKEKRGFNYDPRM